MAEDMWKVDQLIVQHCVCLFACAPLLELQVGHARHNMGFNSDQQPLCQKGGDGAISPTEERERGKKNEGSCEFDTLNSGHH